MLCRSYHSLSRKLFRGDRRCKARKGIVMGWMLENRRSAGQGILCAGKAMICQKEGGRDFFNAPELDFHWLFKICLPSSVPTTCPSPSDALSAQGRMPFKTPLLHWNIETHFEPCVKNKDDPRPLAAVPREIIHWFDILSYDMRVHVWCSHIRPGRFW